MKNNTFLRNLFIIILSFAIIMPNHQLSATGANEEKKTTKNGTFESAAPSEGTISLKQTNILQDTPSVANSVYGSEVDQKIDKIKAMILKRTSTIKGKQKLNNSVLRELTKEEIDQLFLTGAGIEDVYWVNLLINDSNLTPDKIFEMKKNDENTWEAIQKKLLNVGKLSTSVEDAVYNEVELIPISVEDAVYSEDKLEPNKLKLSITAFDTLVNSAFNSLVTQQQINQTNKPKYADNYGSSEFIDPVSGSLTWKESEINLTGRDGLDLNIGVMYNSNYSFAYMRDSSSYGQIKKFNYLISRYDLGMGWSFQFPSVQSTDGYLFYHDGQGAVYRVDFNANDTLGSYTHLSGYQGKDLQFNQDNGTFNNGQATSAYYLQYDNQKREYFASDGRLLGIVDRYGNTIKFQHIDRVTYDGVSNKVISTITDSLGRIVNFSYDTNLNTNDSFTGEKITVSVNTNGLETERVIFTKSRSSLTFNGSPDGYAPVLNYVTNQIGESTNFGYDSSVFAKFNYNQKSIDSYAGDNSYLRLSNVYYPNSSTSYKYELITRNLGPYGVGEEYRITSRNDTINSSINKVNYTYTGEYTGYPSYPDTSYLPTSYTFSSKKTFQSTSATNSLATTMTFNGQSQNILTSTLAANGERKESRNTAFHSLFTYLPTQTTYAEFTAGDTDSTANLLYSEVSYTDWGGLQSETKRLTSAQFGDAFTRSKYTTTYTYEPKFHLLQTKSWFQNSDASLTERYTYNDFGRLITYTNPNNETINYSYENVPGDAKKVSKVIEEKALGNSLVSKVATTYGSQYNYGFPTEVVSDFSNISAYGQKTASSTRKQMTIDMGSGHVIEETDPMNKKTKYTYDQLGRIKTITYPTATNLNGEQYDYEDQFTYTRTYASSSIFDAENKNAFYLQVNSKRKYTQKSNGSITYLSNENSFYDGFGSLRLVQVVDTSAVTQYHFDDLGRAIYVIDPVGNTTAVTFDVWGDQIEAVDSFGNLHISENNLKQRKTTNYIVDASNVAAYRSNPSLASLKTSYAEKNYDQWGQLISNTSYKNWPDQSQSSLVTKSYSYDIAENLVGYVDPNKNLNLDGVSTKFTYDAMDRLVSVKDALNQIVKYVYDKNGLLSRTLVQRDSPYGPYELITKEYNELGMLVNKKDFGSRNENKTYNIFGLLQKRIDRNGTASDYQYDESKQLIRTTLTGSGGNIQKSSLILGSNGIKNNINELYVNGITSSQTTTMDSLNRVSTVSSQSTGYSALAGYTYDRANRTTNFKSTLSGVGSFYTNYQYSKTRIDKVQTNGQITLSSETSVNTIYEYFPNGKIKTITYPTLADGKILKTTYTYDGLNRMSTMKNTIGTSVLSSFTYGYDDNGNITSITETLNNNTAKTTNYTYDKLNRLISIQRSDGGTAQYTYDLLGNRQIVMDTITIQPEVVGSSLTYDLQNTLIGVTKNSSTTSFNYLPSNLRYQKKKDTVTTQYNYNDSGEVIAETRSDGQQANYIRGDRLLVKKDVVASKDYYYLYNGHGDVVQIVNNSGTVVNSYAYDAWGNITSQTEGISNSFKYTGEIYDEETGLYYLRARYYDPSVARFINEDTYEGQIDNPLSLNLYTYVSNNPLIYADPSGNKAWLIHGTWSNPTKSWGDDNSFDKYIEGLFNESSERIKWSGGNNKGARLEAAEDLVENVYEWHLKNSDEPIRLVGHSHGGNVAIMAANLLAEKGVKVETLITIATPVREYHLDKNTSVGQYIHVYNNKDQVQKNGGNAWFLGNTYTRKFKGAENVRAKDAEKPGAFSPNGGPIDSHSSMHSNINIWKKYIEPILKKKN